MGIELVSLLVRDYDEAIAFFTSVLGFQLVEDSPTVGEDGIAKRWVVVRPTSSSAGLLLAEANGAEQQRLVGRQFGDRVGFFLHVEDFDAAYARMARHGVRFLEDARVEPYGKVAVFEDLLGNRWDLIQPRR
jgi:catechol 2,3-dioxygenase-like lactoylglutathione lyase family enzyme